jgi:hypothetical protein
MFAPKKNSLGKSSKIVGVAPEYPEVGCMAGKKQGSPARKSNLSVRKPGGK